MTDALRCEGVSVHMRGRRVLADVSFAAKAGEVTALIGPNGAGKSTLLRAISGLLPFDGTIRLGERSLAKLAASERAKLVSLVPQRSELASAIPVADVVEQGRYAHTRALAKPNAEERAIVAQALAEAAVTELAARPFTELSFGEQRRVLIARALATAAPLLLLDEPTAALDIQHALRLFALVRRLSRERSRTIIVVLHDLDDVLRCADHAVLLRAGQVVAHGRPHEVLDPPRVREVYGVEPILNAGLGFRLADGAEP